MPKHDNDNGHDINGLGILTYHDLAASGLGTAGDHRPVKVDISGIKPVRLPYFIPKDQMRRMGLLRPKPGQ